MLRYTIIIQARGGKVAKTYTSSEKREILHGNLPGFTLKCDTFSEVRSLQLGIISYST